MKVYVKLLLLPKGHACELYKTDPNTDNTIEIEVDPDYLKCLIHDYAAGLPFPTEAKIKAAVAESLYTDYAFRNDYLKAVNNVLEEFLGDEE